MMTELNDALRKLGQPEVEPDPRESSDPLTRIREAAKQWGLVTEPGTKETDNGNPE